jgi:hypothetical protein
MRWQKGKKTTTTYHIIVIGFRPSLRLMVEFRCI